MSKTTDVIVVGSGLAGLMAAYAAMKKGASVQVVSEGMGNLSISPGCIDLLGYDTYGQRVENPWTAMDQLPPEHPYSLIKQDNIKESLTELVNCLSAKGYNLCTSLDTDGNEKNTLMPTIMGTLKPTWLVPQETGIKALDTANDILIVSIKGFRDCRPQLISNQLRRYPGWEDKNFETLVLPAPFDEHGRSLNALDLAHLADRPEGRDWLVNRLRALGKNHDLMLIPPLLGAKPNSPIRTTISEIAGCPVLEMLSIPPGVAGLRIRKALVDTLVENGVEFYENAQVIRADVKDNKCISITLQSTGREKQLSSNSYVIATGGIIGGGILLDQGTATEAIFGINIPVPQNVDEWSETEIFGQHLISRIGMKTGSDLRVPELENVYFAGRILGGYDWASEKSGHGVACASGWHAGKLAAEQAYGSK